MFYYTKFKTVLTLDSYNAPCITDPDNGLCVYKYDAYEVTITKW